MPHLKWNVLKSEEWSMFALKCPLDNERNANILNGRNTGLSVINQTNLWLF